MRRAAPGADRGRLTCQIAVFKTDGTFYKGFPLSPVSHHLSDITP
jgi:hypothetical protein